MYTKLVPETVIYISFTLKLIRDHHLYYLFGTNHLHNLNITLMNNWFIIKTLNIRGVFI